MLVLGHLFWDELLMFVVPVLLVLVAVRWAERRRPPDASSSLPDLDGKAPGNVVDDSPNTKDD
jgi:hypothetical protein